MFVHNSLCFGHVFAGQKLCIPPRESIESQPDIISPEIDVEDEKDEKFKERLSTLVDRISSTFGKYFFLKRVFISIIETFT